MTRPADLITTGLNKMAIINVSWRGYVRLGAVIAAGALTSSALLAQGAPKAPPKRSFSNNEKSTGPQSAQPAPKQATQEELTDAVLGDTMQRLWAQADSHFHEGEYSHVVNLSRIVVQGDPHNMEAFASAAYLLWSTARNEEAVALLNAGIAANPNSYYMYDEMGIYWWLERKDAKAAIPFYEKAVKFDCPWTTWNSLANCYEKLDQWDKAVTAWEKATLFPDNRVAVRRLKQAREKLAQKKPAP